MLDTRIAARSKSDWRLTTTGRVGRTEFKEVFVGDRTSNMQVEYYVSFLSVLCTNASSSPYTMRFRSTIRQS